MMPQPTGMGLLGVQKLILQVDGRCSDLTAEPLFKTLAVKHPNKTCFK